MGNSIFWAIIDGRRGFDLRLSGIRGVQARGIAPVSKEYGKFQPLRAFVVSVALSTKPTPPPYHRAPVGWSWWPHSCCRTSRCFMFQVGFVTKTLAEATVGARLCPRVCEGGSGFISDRP